MAYRKQSLRLNSRVRHESGRQPPRQLGRHPDRDCRRAEVHDLEIVTDRERERAFVMPA
jgi:hypothetical protein